MSHQRPALLLIEDDPPFRSLLSTTLGSFGFKITAAANGRDGLMVARNQCADLLILDLGLPDMDGQDLIRRLRKVSRLPIIVLSARDQESDITQALDNGADDYLTKPFSNAELVSRIKALLRRTASAPGSRSQGLFQTGELKVDLTRRQVWVGGREIHLTPIEYRMLCVLVENAGFVVTHRQLLEKIWGASYVEHNHYPRIYMGQLRHKLEADPARPRYLLTETGVGYRLCNNGAEDGSLES